MSASEKTILVVDDEAIIRMLALEIIADLGYRSIEAENGTSALRLIESDVRIDLLITDLGLPGISGTQLADAARLRHPGLKILFITGSAPTADLDQPQAGTHIMRKPFAMTALAKCITTILAG